MKENRKEYKILAYITYINVKIVDIEEDYEPSVILLHKSNRITKNKIKIDRNGEAFISVYGNKYYLSEITRADI